MKAYFKSICLLYYLMLGIDVASYGQSGINNFLKPSDSLNIFRRNAVIVAESVFYAGGIYGLSKGLDREYLNYKFHYDHSNKLQMDEAAHVFASYQISNLFFNAFKWSGASKKSQLIYGAGMGFVFLTSVELVEGFSRHGASYTDILANGIGTTLFASQELLWNEQRIVSKISFKNLDFVSSNALEMKSELMNGFDDQTVWISLNLHSFFTGSKIPKWLNIAAGYGVEGVVSSNYILINNVRQKAGPYRQFYLSFDADLTKIDTKSRFLKTFFSVFNAIKIPAPTIEYSSNERFRFHILYF